MYEEIYLKEITQRKKISFVGYGRIAKLMHKYAKAFDMDVQAYDPYVHKFCKGVKF